MDQEAIPHYRPPIPAAGGSAGTVRTVAPDPTPTRTLPPVWASTSLRRMVAPGALTIAHRGGHYRPTREPALDYLQRHTGNCLLCHICQTQAKKMLQQSLLNVFTQLQMLQAPGESSGFGAYGMRSGTRPSAHSRHKDGRGNFHGNC
jgi:hypothetical protein